VFLFLVSLQVLYKLKSAKVFDTQRCANSEPSSYPFAVEHLYLCVDSRVICVAGVSYVLLFKYNKLEATLEFPVSRLALSFFL